MAEQGGEVIGVNVTMIIITLAAIFLCCCCFCYKMRRRCCGEQGCGGEGGDVDEDCGGGDTIALGAGVNF